MELGNNMQLLIWSSFKLLDYAKGTGLVEEANQKAKCL